jgi:predicted PurR-regulated permease PerM
VDPGPDPADPAVAPDPAGVDPPAPSARDQMPVWVPRALVFFFVGVIGVLVLRWLIAELQSLIFILLVSLFLSFALEPAVNFLAARGVRRGLATGLVMFGGFLGLVAFVALIGSALFTQVSDFIDELPEYIEDVEQRANDQLGWELDTDELIEEVQNQDFGEVATNLAGSAVALGISAVGVIFNLFTIALFTFYMVADGPRFRRTVLQFLPRERQERVIQGWEIAIEKTGGYIYSRGLLALMSAFATSVALEVMGVPYAIALGLWTGLISQFIPTVGTYLAGALPVIVALLEDPVDAVIVLIFILVYQQVENYVFAPKITARTMDLHPAVAFGTVIAGAAMFGPVGALLALPAAAVVQAIGSTYFHRHEVIDSAMTREGRDEKAPPRRRRSTDPPDGPDPTLLRRNP